VKLPGRRQLEAAGEPVRGVRGEQVYAASDRHGVVDDGNTAWPERVAEASRSWPQARPEDFERVGKRGYKDRATGVEYLAVRGAPLLSVATEETRGITAFMVEGQRLVFLRRPDYEAPLTRPTGYVHSQQVSPATPGPEGPRIY